MNRFFAKVALGMLVLWTLGGCVPSAASNTASPAPTQLPAASSPTLLPFTQTTQPPEPTHTVRLPEPLAPTLEPQVVERARLLRVAMIDEQNGWGLGEGQVLRTTEGGAQWVDVSPSGASGTAGGSFFLDESKGWVLYPDPADFNRGMLQITSDSGQSWEAVVTPFSAGHLQFLDAQSGMALIVTGAAAGSAPADIYRTQDQGRTWVKIYGIDPAQEDPHGLPFSGMKSGLAFLDASRGWVTGSVPMEAAVWLYLTQDGGQTWQPQTLALPEAYANAMLSIEPPRFFSPQEGILPVLLYTATPAWVFYTTRDAGATWTSTTPVEGSGLYDFISPLEGWVWDGKLINTTKDGGKTWSAQETNVDASERLAQLDFVSSKVGWALLMDAEGNTQLFKTEDGGITWNE